ncbi:MAG: hypothetical protein FJ104_07025, partial [Deltaproteobacteria bacterium]|nr:hypothetical protein [Deltaproteobacteria bacterium]
MIQRLFTAALLVVWSLFSWSPARAGDDAFPEPGASLFRAVDEARGPLAVTELRGLWDAWDHLDPEQIEAALDAAGASPHLGPGPRSYARLLAAYARLRRGDPAAAAREVEGLGFVTDWIVVGPFDNEGGEGHGRALGPEAEAPGPIVPGRAYGGKLRPVRPRRVPPGAFRYGFVDGTSLLRPDRKICLVATTFVAARPGRPPGDLLAWIGVGGTWKLHWDGEELAADGAERRYDADRRVVRLPFGPGTHRFVLKVCTEDVAPIFSLRLSDLRGAPDGRLDVSADTARSAEPVPAKGSAARPRPASPISGPLDIVERDAL